ncbi:MAG: hypothetical protein AAB606_04100, partial [Patescibacteria group bacterium]
LESANGRRELYEKADALSEIETVRAAMVKAIGNVFGINDKDLCVLTWTQKLRESDSWTEFDNAFQRALGELEATLLIELDSGGGNNQVKVFKQALIDLIPSWMKRDKDAGEVNRLLKYALAELMWIIRKASKGVILFHPTREIPYVRLAKAYSGQVQLCPPDMIDSYVYSSKLSDGAMLPRRPVDQRAVKSKDLRLKLAPAYRCIDPAGRVLLYPADDVLAIKDKLSGGGLYPKDVRERLTAEYIQQMMLQTLRIARRLIKRTPQFRKYFDKVLSTKLLSDGLADPAVALKNSDRIINAFHELVIGPCSAAIDTAVQLRTITAPDDMPVVSGAMMLEGK